MLDQALHWVLCKPANRRTCSKEAVEGSPVESWLVARVGGCMPVNGSAEEAGGSDLPRTDG